MLSVSVTPPSISLNAGESQSIAASVSTSSCSALPAISWTSADPAKVSVVGNGTGALVTGVAPTGPPLLITATAGGVSGTTLVSVAPLPAIAVNTNALSFSATQGGANPASQAATITNSGGGTLAGLGIASITYGPGASGWLQAPSFSGTTANPSVSVTVQPLVGSLVAGTYTASIAILAGLASNTPQILAVTLVVAPPPPAISLSPALLAFTATQGSTNPPSQATTISNSGGGTLSGLSVGAISYGAGAADWLQPPTLSGTIADPTATLTLQPLVAGLLPGSYSATVAVVSGVASNSPQLVTVTLTISPPPPAIVLTPEALTFNATQGGGNPASQSSQISNGGGGVLTGLSIGPISYGPGAAGWLLAPTLSGTAANPAVSVGVQPITGSLTAGSYTATIPVQSSVASNSPRLLSVTLVIGAPALDPCLPANALPINVGQTINGGLTSSGSCLLATGQFAQFYRFNIASPTLVAMNLASSFDNFLSLQDGSTNALIEEDDDDGPGLDARIVRMLPPGAYLLRVSSFDPGVTGPYSLSVQEATAGPPASISVNAGDGQTSAPNTSVSIAPSAIVRDANGTPVGGVLVSFSTVPGVGGVTGASAVTSSGGIATVGSWTLAAGPNVLAASVAGLGSPAVFSATGAASTAGFSIDLRFLSMPTAGQFAAFAAAVQRWQTIITGDLTDIPVQLPGSVCTVNAPALDETIDDLVIQVALEPIDGPGAVLGSAGPCFIRATGLLPLLGTMRFDVADLATMESNGTLNAVILHEIGHILGIGTLWPHPSFGFLANPSLPSSPGVDTRYTGANGIAGFDAIGGATYTGGGKVPVENLQGGSGTRDAHWRESVLANELMTGFVAVGSTPLSLLTVRSLQDFGYVVNPANADPFFLALTLKAEGTTSAPVVHLRDDIYRGPLYLIDRQGRIRDLQGFEIRLLRTKR